MPQDIYGGAGGGTPLKILTTFLYRYLSIVWWPHRLPCLRSAAVCELGMNESLLFDTLLSPAARCSYLRVDGNTIQSLFSLEQNSFDGVKAFCSWLPASLIRQQIFWIELFHRWVWVWHPAVFWLCAPPCPLGPGPHLSMLMPLEFPASTGPFGQVVW